MDSRLQLLVAVLLCSTFMSFTYGSSLLYYLSLIQLLLESSFISSSLMLYLSRIPILILILHQKGQSTPAFTVANVQSYTVVARSGNSTLYTVNLDNGANYSSGLVQVIDLRGSRYQMGFDYGYLLGQEIIYNFNRLFHALLGGSYIFNSYIRNLPIFSVPQHHRQTNGIPTLRSPC